jgi:hypothetical protein
MEIIKVGLGERAYEIVIGCGARSFAAELTGRRNFLVTDSRIAGLWGKWAERRFRRPDGSNSPPANRAKPRKPSSPSAAAPPNSASTARRGSSRWAAEWSAT